MKANQELVQLDIDSNTEWRKKEEIGLRMIIDRGFNGRQKHGFRLLFPQTEHLPLNSGSIALER